MNKSAVSPGLVLAAFLLLALLSGCGDDSTGSEDPATGSVSLLMKTDVEQTPVEGAVVVQQDPSGAVLAETTTDVNGAASLQITAGDMVTSQKPEPTIGYRAMTTVVGVEPGDTLDFFREETDWGAVTDDVVLTGDVPAPYDNLEYSTGCEGGGGPDGLPRTTSIYEGCASESGLLHVLLETSNLGSKQSFAYWVDVPFDESGTTTLDFTGSWRSDWQTVTCTPPALDLATFSNQMFWNERDGAWFSGIEATTDVGKIAPTYTLRVPRGFPDFVAMYHFSVAPSYSVEMFERVPLSESTTSIAYTQEMPTLAAVELDSTDPARPFCRWSVDAPGLPGDAQVLELSWRSGEDRYYWEAILPPRTRSFQFPDLPESFLQSLPPVPSVENEMRASILFFEGSYTDGYDDYRRALRERDRFFSNRGEAGFEVVSYAYFATPYTENNKAAGAPLQPRRSLMSTRR